MLFATATMALAADVVTFNMSDPNAYVAETNKVDYPTTESQGAQYASGTVFSVGNVKMTLTYKSNGGLKAFLQKGSKVIQARVYGGAVLTLETTDGLDIKNVSVAGQNFTSTYFSADCGTMSTGEWSGASKKLVLTCVKSTVQINEMKITTAPAGSLSAPKFSVAGGTYYEKQTVTITNPNTTGKVYYTLDESNPNAESTEYTAPIEIAETKTLKAIIIEDNDESSYKESAVTSATYTIKEMPTVASISEFLQLSKGDKAKFTNSIVVAAVYKKGNSVSYYCTDETGGIQLYDATGKIQEYNAKDVIPAGFVAEYTLYQNTTPEATNITGLTAATEQKEAPYTVITAEEITKDMVGAAVQIKNAEISEISGSNFKVGDATGTVAAYNKFSLEKVEAYKNIVVTGIVSIFNNAVQIMPYDINYEGGTSGVTEVEDADKVEVIPGNGEIIVNGAGDVNVYDVQGRRTTTVKGSGEYPPKKKTHVIETEAGVYIVVADGEVVKVKVD